MNLYGKLRDKFSELRHTPLVLIVGNVVPLLCILAFGWRGFFLFALYWLENIIIGIINVFKMVTCLIRNGDSRALLMIPFFIFHYGIFAMGHGYLVVALFGGGDSPPVVTMGHGRISVKLPDTDVRPVSSGSTKIMASVEYVCSTGSE